MHFRTGAKERQAAPVSQRHRQASMHKRFPIVGIKNNVTDLPLPIDVGHPPVVAHALAGLVRVLAEWATGCSHVATVTGNHDAGVG